MAKDVSAEKTLDFSIKVNRARAIAFFVAGLGLITVYHWAGGDWLDKENLRDTIKTAVIFLTAGVAVYAVLQTADRIKDNTEQVRQSAEEFQRSSQERRVRFALEVAGKWISSEARDLRSDWGPLAIRLRKLSENKRSAYLCDDENAKDRAVVLDVLNYFEQVAVAVKLGVADEKTVRLHQESLAREYVKMFDQWLTEWRKQKSATLYEELQKMVNKWKTEPRS